MLLHLHTGYEERDPIFVSNLVLLLIEVSVGLTIGDNLDTHGTY